MNEDYGKVIECPICKGQVVSVRVNDDSQFLYFNKDGTHRYSEGKCRGYSDIYCATDKTHDLGDELVQIVLELTNEVL